MILKNARFSLDTMLKWQRRYDTTTENKVKNMKQKTGRKRINRAQSIVIELNAKEEIRVFDDMIPQVPLQDRTAFMIEHGYPLIIVETDQSGNTTRKTEYNLENRAELPDYVFESFARALLPSIQEYYAAPEGRAAYEEWKKHKAEQSR